MTIARRQSWRGISMSLFGFRTRNPKRDHETDVARYHRLISVIEQLYAEMASERDGMQTRYQSTEESAAFAMQALENGEGSGLSDKVEDLTRTMQHFHARIASLDRQLAFMSAMETDAKAFLEALAREFAAVRDREDGSLSRIVAEPTDV